MYQAPLLTLDDVNTRTVTVEGVTATLIKVADEDYEVLLEINSNKILVGIQWALDTIEELEILAVKGFVELSKSFIATIKKLIGHLLCRMD